MTIDERNNINDRDRIKQYLECTTREMCDAMCDDNSLDLAMVEKITNLLLIYSQIYKNMGFDKAGVENED